MGKKRRVWWIVGSLVAAVALFAGLASLSFYNSADARIDRAVAQIAEEYGFELQDQMPTHIGYGLSGKSYSRAPVSAEMESKIVLAIREAFPSYVYELRVYKLTVGYEEIGPGTTSSREQSMEAHIFHETDPRGGVPAGIAFVPDDNGFGRPGPEPTADISAFKLGRPGLWQRIKGLWPW